MFKYNTRVRLRDTDAFGLIYFTEQLNYCVEAFQEFLIEKDIAIADNPKASPFVLPVVHCQSDFVKPLGLNDSVEVVIKNITTGTTSITLDYIINKDDTQVGSATTVHVCIDNKTGKSMPVPQKFKDSIS